LRQAASSRSTSAVKAPAEAQITDAEKILIRALASAHQMQQGQIEANHVDSDQMRRNPMERNQAGHSTRSVAGHTNSVAGFTKEAEFDPARQAAYILQNETLHHGLATESLVESLLNVGTDFADILQVPASESDRRLLAAILFKEEEDLTAEILEASVRALRRIHLRRRQEEIQQELKKTSPAAVPAANKDRIRALLAELERITRTLRDPGMSGEIKAAS
jgi:hypothetical protein